MNHGSFKNGEIREIELLKGNLRYRESDNAPESHQKTGFSEPECDPNGKKKPSSRTPKGKIKAICLECALGMGAVRNCSCYECPLWGYRPYKGRNHKALLEAVEAGGTPSEGVQLDDEEPSPSQISAQIFEARKRVLAKARRFCPKQIGYFERAFSGRSRSAALKAEKLYLANFEASMVERD